MCEPAFEQRVVIPVIKHSTGRARSHANQRALTGDAIVLGRAKTLSQGNIPAFVLSFLFRCERAMPSYCLGRALHFLTLKSTFVPSFLPSSVVRSSFPSSVVVRRRV